MGPLQPPRHRLTPHPASPTATPTATATAAPTNTATATPTGNPTQTASAVPTPTSSPSPVPTNIATQASVPTPIIVPRRRRHLPQTATASLNSNQSADRDAESIAGATPIGLPQHRDGQHRCGRPATYGESELACIPNDLLIAEIAVRGGGGSDHSAFGMEPCKRDNASSVAQAIYGQRCRLHRRSRPVTRGPSTMPMTRQAGSWRTRSFNRGPLQREQWPRQYQFHQHHGAVRDGAERSHVRPVGRTFPIANSGTVTVPTGTTQRWSFHVPVAELAWPRPLAAHLRRFDKQRDRGRRTRHQCRWLLALTQ